MAETFDSPATLLQRFHGTAQITTLELEPGHSATVLDVFDNTDGIPVAIIAGTEMNDPPPASAFMMPARKPATKRKKRTESMNSQ